MRQGILSLFAVMVLGGCFGGASIETEEYRNETSLADGTVSSAQGCKTKYKVDSKLLSSADLSELVNGCLTTSAPKGPAL